MAVFDYSSVPCYHPLTAWRGPVLPSGKRAVVFKPSESTGGLVAFPHKLPCGQCVGCRLDYSLDWAARLVCENQMSSASCFITVTYDEAHLPKAHSHLKSRRECWSGSLCVDEWQRFMKKLRKKVGLPIRFFHAGEYGAKFGRPHFHALIFGYDFPDRVLLKQSASGSCIYTSKMLSEVWLNGFASVGDVTYESAAYVARYCLKKADSLGDRFVENGVKYDVNVKTGEIKNREHVTMSRRPGIGHSWLKKFERDVYPHDVMMVRGGTKRPAPRYFDTQYELNNPVDMARIKKLRSARNGRREEVWSDVLQKYQTLDVSRDDRLAVQEEVKLATIKNLRRNVDNG